ncbi:unnamed protein product [Tenebrio molitor]|nr:unnamed protein product [Tenebrio molitor]
MPLDMSQEQENRRRKQGDYNCVTQKELSPIVARDVLTKDHKTITKMTLKRSKLKLPKKTLVEFFCFRKLCKGSKYSKERSHPIFFPRSLFPRRPSSFYWHRGRDHS